MNLEDRVLTNKEAITKIVKLAVEEMNYKRERKYSNHTLALMLKDNLHQYFKEFCSNERYEYIKSGLSQRVIIDSDTIKLKMHNSLGKKQRKIVNQVEGEYEQLKLTNTELFEFPEESEWELGIELSLDRKILLNIRLADFKNDKVISLYRHVEKHDNTVTEQEVVDKNVFTSKNINTEELEIANAL